MRGAHGSEKRETISLTLGVLVLVVLESKLIIQSIWKLNMDQYDAIPHNILKSYELWRQELEFIECINVNKWLGLNRDDPPHTELHVYSDASNCAYGIADYFALIVVNRERYLY